MAIIGQLARDILGQVFSQHLKLAIAAAASYGQHRNRAAASRNGPGLRLCRFRRWGHRGRSRVGFCAADFVAQVSDEIQPVLGLKVTAPVGQFDSLLQFEHHRAVASFDHHRHHRASAIRDRGFGPDPAGVDRAR